MDRLVVLFGLLNSRWIRISSFKAFGEIKSNAFNINSSFGIINFYLI